MKILKGAMRLEDSKWISESAGEQVITVYNFESKCQKMVENPKEKPKESLKDPWDAFPEKKAN